MKTSEKKEEAYLPGWKPDIAAQVPLLHQRLKSMTSQELQKQAPLPTISQASKDIVFTHDSYYSLPRWHTKTALEAMYPNKALNTYEVSEWHKYSLTI